MIYLKTANLELAHCDTRKVYLKNDLQEAEKQKVGRNRYRVYRGRRSFLDFRCKTI
jgi:hypothetical protein